ncbi:MAG: ParB/RepB/Spo0J family partition protein [Nitrososphaerales archaeon]
MPLELPLASIESNPYNSRIKYHPTAIDRLAQSFRSNGQLSVVKVRPSAQHEGHYELVFGHRRVMAARKLGWKTIRAEVVNTSEEEMIDQSLVENFEHEDLSDYEKAVIFERMSNEFGRTYEQIGKMLGISKQHVSNYMGMLRLFSPEVLSSNPELLEAIQQMSEHHARVLSRIDDLNTKIDLASMIARDKLSVKELTNIVGRLRSWFTVEEIQYEGSRADEGEIWCDPTENIRDGRYQEDDIEEITKIVVNEFRLAHKGDFNSYKDMHLFGEGFSIYSAFPPFGRFEGGEALSKEREWFYEIAPKLSWKIRDLKIDILGEAALATLTVSYSGKYLGDSLKMELRGTVVLTRKDVSWKILHEHWSRQDVEPIRMSSRVHPRSIHSSAVFAH